MKEALAKRATPTGLLDARSSDALSPSNLSFPYPPGDS